MHFIELKEFASSYTVGYMANTNAATATFFGGGSMFVTVGGGTNTYHLFDFTITGFTPNKESTAKGNYIQFMKPGICEVDDSRAYYYWNGWKYKFDTDTTTAGAAAPNVEIPAGTGFLCSFGKSTSKINFSGEVGEAPNGISIGVPSSDASFFFAYNPYPTRIRLADMTITGFTPNKESTAKGNYIQFMKTGVCEVEDSRGYYYWNGWKYKFDTATTTAGAAVEGEIYIEPGEGFLCSFGKATSKLNLPAFNLQ